MARSLKPLAQRRLSAAVLMAAALRAPAARADVPSLRLDYEAIEGCPGEDAMFDEIRWRTSLARRAAPGEPAMDVNARIVRRGALVRGRVTVGEGADRVTREIEGASCEEVVSALALVTALAIDPKAATRATRPLDRPETPPPPAEAPAGPPLGAAPPSATRLPPALPDIVPPPLPALLARDASPDPRSRWTVGAHAAGAFSAAPRPLLGFGLLVDRAFGGGFRPSVRLTLDVEATGSFDIGPGGASFLRGAVRAEGCAFALEPTGWLSLVPCLGVEVGALRGEGVLESALTHVQGATTPWASAGVLPRASFDVGALAVEVQGGPAFPLVRHSFVFQTPAYLIYELPAVTWTVLFGLGAHFR